MREYTPPNSSVNTKKVVLDLKNGSPYLWCDDHITSFADHPFSRWYLKVNYPNLTATEAGCTWYFNENPLSTFKPSLLKTTPRGDFQRLALKRMALGNCALWIDMGLGKTWISIARCIQLFEQYGHHLFLILCPGSVIKTWEEEVAAHVKEEAGAEVLFVHGPRRKKILAELKTTENKSPTFAVTTYETATRIVEELSAVKFSVLIFDEVSKAKTWGTLRTKAAHSLAQELNCWTYLLSGTPSTKKLSGYYSLYELLGRGWSGCSTPEEFSAQYTKKVKFVRLKLPTGRILAVNSKYLDTLRPRKEDFENNSIYQKRRLALNETQLNPTYLNLGFRYTENRSVNKNPDEILILGYFNKELPNEAQIPRLNLLTKQLAYAVNKKEVAKDLPPVIVVKRHITLCGPSRKAYDDFLDTNRAQIDSTPFTFNHSDQSPHVKLHQLANGFIMRPNQGTAFERAIFFEKQPKLDELRALITEYPNEKMIIWAPYRALLEKISRTLANKGLKVGQIHGGTARNERSALIDSFRDPDGIDYLICNPDVAGIGLNLQNSHIQIWYTNFSKPDIKKQAIDRQNRMGQTKTVICVELIASNTLEPRILTNVYKEIDLENQVLAP